MPTFAIANGDFESSTVNPGSDQQNPTDPAWTYTGSAGVSANSGNFQSGTAGFIANPSPGINAGYIAGSSASIGQSITADTGGSFTLSFQSMQRQVNNPAPQAVAVQVDGTTVGTYNPADDHAYHSFTTPQFTLTAGPHTVSFVGTVGNGTALIDNVSLVSAGSSTPTVTSVAVSPSTASVAGGSTQQFAATVTGTNSPAQTVTWSASVGTINSAGLYTAPAATSSAQTATITATSTADGTKSGTATATVAAAPSNSGSNVVFLPSNSACWFSALVWDDNGAGNKLAQGTRSGATSAWTTNGGKFRATWTTTVTSSNVATLAFDTSQLEAASVPTSAYPRLKYRIGNGAWSSAQIPAGTNSVATLNIAPAGVTGAGTYTLHLIVAAVTSGYARYTPISPSVIPPASCVLKSLTVDPGSTGGPPVVLPKVLAVFGDSIVEGVESGGFSTNNELTQNDASLVWVNGLAVSLNAEASIIGIGGQGYERGGGGSTPSLPTAFPNYSAGRPRDFTQPIDFLVIDEGTNDAIGNVSDADVTSIAATLLATARTSCGSATQIFLAVPFGGFKRAALTAAFSQYQAATPDAKCHLLDAGTGFQNGLTAINYNGTWQAPLDGLHPDAPCHGRAAAVFAEQIQAILDGGSSSSSSSSGLTTNQAVQLNDVQAKVDALAAMLTANGIKADVEAIAGSAPAAAALEAQSLATAFPDSAKAQIGQAVLGTVGALETGKTLAQSLRKVLAGIAGIVDITTAPNMAIFRLEDGTEAFRTPVAGRTAVTDGVSL